MTSETLAAGNMADLETFIAERAQGPEAWAPPQIFDLSDATDRARLSEMQGLVRRSVDRVDLIAADLFDFRYPDSRGDQRLREEFTDRINRQGLCFGKWVFFPWSGELIRYPNEVDHLAIRTSRNRNLITAQEQVRLYRAKIAVFGLSVGSKEVEELVGSGIGGTIILGDRDYITPSNLNRMRGSIQHVGMVKLDKVAQDVSRVDPYAKQIHFRQGITEAGLEELAEHRPDIIFDAVDDLRIKALLRQFAQREGIPLVMITDLDDKSIVDVERYDLGGAQPFNGRLKVAEINRLCSGACTPQELLRLTVKVVGMRQVTPRVLGSVLQVGRVLGGYPQLGTTATIGGGLAAIAAREIILDRNLSTGRYVHSAQGVLGLEPQGSLLDMLRLVRQLSKAT